MKFLKQRRVDSQAIKLLAAPQKAKTHRWIPSRTYTVGKMYPYRNIVAGSLCALPVFLITTTDATLGPSSLTAGQTGFFYLDPAASMDISLTGSHDFSLSHLVDQRAISRLPLFVDDDFYQAHAVSVFMERSTVDGDEDANENGAGSGNKVRTVEYLGNFFLQGTGTFLPLSSLRDSAKPYLIDRFSHHVTAPSHSPVPGMSYSAEQVGEMYEKCQMHERVNLVWAECLRGAVKSMEAGANSPMEVESSRGQTPATPVQTRQATNRASPRLLQDENVRC